MSLIVNLLNKWKSITVFEKIHFELKSTSQAANFSFEGCSLSTPALDLGALKLLNCIKYVFLCLKFKKLA